MHVTDFVISGWSKTSIRAQPWRHVIVTTPSLVHGASATAVDVLQVDVSTRTQAPDGSHDMLPLLFLAVLVAQKALHLSMLLISAVPYACRHSPIEIRGPTSILLPER